MLPSPALTGSLLTGAGARCGSEAIAGVPSGPGGLTGRGEALPARPIAGAPGGVDLSEEKPVRFSGGTAMDFTGDLDLTIGCYEIATEDRIALTGKSHGFRIGLGGAEPSEPGAGSRPRGDGGPGKPSPGEHWDYNGASGCSLTPNPSLSRNTHSLNGGPLR